MYKVFKRDNNGKLISPFQKFEYEEGKEYVCVDFDTNPQEDCSMGYYATDIDGLIFSFRNLPSYEVWECKVSGQKVEYDQFKRRYEKLKLLRQVPFEEVKQLALAEEPKVGYKLAEALFPVNPLKIQRNSLPTKTEIELLEKWNSVRGSVGASVRDSVRTLVGASVWNSVGDSVGDSFWVYVNDSLYAYISSLFPNIKKWEGIYHEEGVNPFQSGIDLWKRGLVPSFDGIDTWRLHAGKDARVVYEWKK